MSLILSMIMNPVVMNMNICFDCWNNVANFSDASAGLFDNLIESISEFFDSAFDIELRTP